MRFLPRSPSHASAASQFLDKQLRKLKRFCHGKSQPRRESEGLCGIHVRVLDDSARVDVPIRTSLTVECLSLIVSVGYAGRGSCFSDTDGG